MKDYSNQYTFLFSLSWAVIYLVFPSWALPIPVAARGSLYFGLIVYFVISSYVINRCFKTISINEPVIVYAKNAMEYVKNNIWLFIVCFMAALIQIKYILTPIFLIGDEGLFIQGGLWVYDYFGAFWHKVGKYSFWIAIIFSLFILNRAGNSGGRLLKQNLNKKAVSLFVFSGLSLIVVYFILNRNLPFDNKTVRYPPLHDFLYLISFYIVGINYLGPRAVQFIFYILSAVYLYRTINLFHDKETSLLGASIYLFSPIVFLHGHFAELASGVNFFMIIISYYFLRYLVHKDNRSLLLTSYFIGIGFLYKLDIYLMLFVCFAYLVLYRFRNKELRPVTPFKVLLMALIPIIPWLTIHNSYNWRGAWVSLSKFTALDTAIRYLLLIPAQISWIIFILFVISVGFILVTKRSHLSLFFALLFFAFYFLYTSQSLNVAVDRFAMAFYPTIAVFIALLFSHIGLKIRWKHSFKLVFSVITLYLIMLCAVPSFSERLITTKNEKEHYFPSEEAMQWVRDNVKNGEKILTFRIRSDLYYRDKYAINNDKIAFFWYNLSGNSTPQKLKAYCHANKISYYMFPFGPRFAEYPEDLAMWNALKENKNDFIEVAKFNLKENYIFIYKITD